MLVGNKRNQPFKTSDKEKSRGKVPQPQSLLYSRKDPWLAFRFHPQYSLFKLEPSLFVPCFEKEKGLTERQEGRKVSR